MSREQTSGAVDSHLIGLASMGDHNALSDLLAHCQPIIMRQVQRFPLSGAEHSDLVQDAMLHVIRKLSTFRGDAQFSTWLYRVTANTVLMKLRSIRRRRLSPLDVHTEEAEPVLARSNEVFGNPDAARIDERFEESRRRARLEEALEQLPSGYKELIMEHYVDGRSLREVAERHDTTESAVRSRLHRARATLRRVLQDLRTNTEVTEETAELVRAA